MDDISIREFLIFIATVQSASSSPMYNFFPINNMENSGLQGMADSNVENFQITQDNELYLDFTTPDYNDTTTYEPDNHNIDSWSIMWYLISFGGLITFFLLVSFSEVCCKKSIPVLTEVDDSIQEVSSPPPYDLFAPPTYDSLFEEKKSEKSKKGKSKHKKTNIYFIVLPDDKVNSEPIRENPLEFGEVISRNSMGDGEVVTPPPPP